MGIFMRMKPIFALALSLVLTSGFAAEKRVCVIVNPISGGIDKKALVERIQESLSQFEVEILYTQRAKHASELAKDAVERHADIVIAVGGDGSVNEVGQALIGSEAALGIIPTGSGNGLARHLRIPLEVDQAIEVIKNGHAQTIDTVKVNDRYYLGVAGIGFDAEIGWAFAKFGKRGFLPYVLLTLAEFPKYEPKIYELSIDGEEISREAFLISFANSSQFGGEAEIAPKAKIDDGYLDVVILKKFPLLSAPKLAYQLFHSKFNRSRYVETRRGKKITVKGENLKVHLDGEPVLFSNQMDLEVLPHSLIVLVP